MSPNAQRSGPTTWRHPPDEYPLLTAAEREVLDYWASPEGQREAKEAAAEQLKRNMLAALPKQRTAATGALRQWWSERRAGVPRTFGHSVWETDKRGETTWRFAYDPLYHAACLEASARDFDGAGLADIADSMRAKAADVVSEEVVRRGAA